ncbi:hypothetical protein J5X84_33705 [Streptosporangiaceae bacterium NEAU-GS5]|nr:hypothetical protein [Streptosporangiaceae bacterium NEAU-GS5]
MTTVIGAASLLLAMLIMISDRKREQRRQIEAVGAWATLDEVARTVTVHLRNTNSLPIFAVHVEVGLAWHDEDFAERRRWVPGTLHGRYGTRQARRTSVWDHERGFHWSVVAPGGGIDEPYVVPEPSSPPTQALVTVRSLSLVDTGGRRWRAHPGRAVPPKIIERIHPF